MLVVITGRSAYVRMPGGASHTAGMALTAGTAVIRMPMSRNSSTPIVVRSASGQRSSLIRTLGSPATSTT